MTFKIPQPRLTDLKALERHRARARLGEAGFLHALAADEVKERLKDVNRRFTNAAIVSPFPEIWNGALLEGLAETAYVIPADDTLAVEPGAHDLVIHAMSLHWADDPVGQIVQCRRALRPDGFFLAVAFAGETLSELRECLSAAEVALTGGLSPRVAPMAEIRQLGSLLQRAGFALPVADLVTQDVSYANLGGLMRDLRGMGETNALHDRHRATPPKELFRYAEEIYRSRYAGEDGRLLATFELAFLSGWTPHESQQKPLRPGSATTRLADALGADAGRET